MWLNKMLEKITALHYSIPISLKNLKMKNGNK